MKHSDLAFLLTSFHIFWKSRGSLTLVSGYRWKSRDKIHSKCTVISKVIKSQHLEGSFVISNFCHKTIPTSLVSLVLGCNIKKLCCKYVFENEVSSQAAFCQLRWDEVRMQLLAKGVLLIKDAKLLDLASYSDHKAVLVALRKRIWSTLYIPFRFPFFSLLM